MREDTSLYPGLTCTLLCYKDIRKNGLHVETHVDGKEELFTSLSLWDMANKFVKISSLEYVLYYTYIKPICFVAYKVIFRNINSFQAWHDRLSHHRVE
jgi:hypothetical protein